MQLGPKIAILGLDMRSERTKSRILPESTHELFLQRAQKMDLEVKHLVVLSGVPVVWPAVSLSAP